MKISFTKKSMMALIIGMALTVILVAASYLSTIQPKLNELSSTENSLETERQMLELLQQNNVDQEEKIAERTTELQRKLPVAHLLDQLLLDFVRVETLSNTYIEYIDIDQNRDAMLFEGEDEDGNTEEAETSEGLKQITAYMSIRANSYEDLFQFLAEMDRLPRIVGIDSISFLGKDEKIMIDDEKESLEFLVTVSTYYYPELLELKDELPKVIHPEPSEKKNPLYNQ